jgi:DNA gyrase/topoisomerase IV subunit A
MSYVILERAVPAIEDGKPVQRRIMHSPKELMMVVITK